MEENLFILLNGRRYSSRIWKSMAQKTDRISLFKIGGHDTLSLSDRTMGHLQSLPERQGQGIMSPKSDIRSAHKKLVQSRRNPVPTVDVIIEIKNKAGKKGIILIKRKNPPFGWALPGGFVDYGESLEKAAVREAKEETSLKVILQYQLHTYSDPGRDPRLHTISTVFVAKAKGMPKAQDDAREIRIFSRDEINFPLAFDHRQILDDYFRRKELKKEPRPKPGKN